MTSLSSSSPLLSPVAADGSPPTTTPRRAAAGSISMPVAPGIDRRSLIYRTYLFVQGQYGLASVVFSRWIVLLIVANTLAFILNSDPDITASLGGQDVFDNIETVSVSFFTIEYIARTWSCIVDPQWAQYGPTKGRLWYMVSWSGLIDFIAIAPWYISWGYDTNLSFAASLRVVRFFRLLKFDSYTRALGILKTVFFKEKEVLLISGFYCIIALLLGSSLLFLLDDEDDPYEFSTIPVAMHTVWMLFMGTFPITNLPTVSTVIVSMLMLVGLTLVWVPLGIVSAGIVEIMNERRASRKGDTEGEAAEGDGEGDDAKPKAAAGDEDDAKSDSKPPKKKKSKTGAGKGKRRAGAAPHCVSCRCGLHPDRSGAPSIVTSSSLATPADTPTAAAAVPPVPFVL